MTHLAYEFFAGGGMARLGLGPGWRIGLANDMAPEKCAAYRANFGGEHLIEGDVFDLKTADLPDHADLAWASFPCQDLSLAGTRGGLAGTRSAAFWGFWALIDTLKKEGRPPRSLIIENVTGFASSRGGRDLALALSALAKCSYYYDLRIMDAADFLPQSRPRLFILAWQKEHISPPRSTVGTKTGPLNRTLARLPQDARRALRPLSLTAPPCRPSSLGALVEPDMAVFSQEKTTYLLSMMAEPHRARLDAAQERARRTGSPRWGTYFRRTRNGAQRVEVRFDGAGCLRTPAGGSSRQGLIALHPSGAISARLITGREAARLMGLPESYRLPGSATQALRLMGDGVAVPVVRHIETTFLSPLLSGSLEPAAAAE